MHMNVHLAKDDGHMAQNVNISSNSETLTALQDKFFG